MKKTKSTNLLIIIILFIIIVIIVYLFLKSKDKYRYFNCTVDQENLKNNRGGLKAIWKNRGSNQLWEVGEKVTISFLNNPGSLTRSTTKSLTCANPDYHRIAYDPLEFDLLHEDIKIAIQRVIDLRFKPLVNLNFEYLADNNTNADIRIQFFHDGRNFSKIGNVSRKTKPGPSMHLSEFSVQTVLHEFCHILGMEHEHASYEAKVIKNIETDKQLQRVLFDMYCEEEEIAPPGAPFTDCQNRVILNNKKIVDDGTYDTTNYDQKSIMNYETEKLFFTDGRSTLYPRWRLSISDMFALMNMYPGGPLMQENPKKSINAIAKTFHDKISYKNNC